MEVLVGPTFGIEVSSSSSAAAYVSSQDENSPPCIFLKEDEIVGSGSLIGAPDASSGSSSSIGSPDDSEDEEGEEVNSVILSKSGLSSLDSLEESLPIKSGLSNHFTGKSKSFANLSDVLMSSSSVTVKDLEKPENPFNKRRRLILANKWSRKSFYSWSNPKSMPLLTLNEEHEEQNQHEEEDEEEEEESQASPSSSSSEHDLLRNQPRFSKLQEKKFKKSFKSHSCFSLADLQHQEFQ
ncbi:protein OXIDATIVE STRESS 3 LIKE 4-like [Euphorbia lathyris]|uniref:protein OXIDATIVE STRESS 3 LIKE 4-like n=1 Tax=Euphorbia lathyris TaxID=212925 RepID=UPI003313E611